MISRVLSGAGIAVVLASLIPGGRLRADDDMLGRYVPSAVHFYGSWKSTPETRRLSTPLEKAFERLVDSGIGEDLFRLATVEMGSDERETVREEAGKVLRLLASADWRSMCRHEVSFAYRIQFPVPEYAFLFRVPAEDAAKRQAELKTILEGLAAYAPDALYVTDANRLEAKVSTLSSDGFPLAVSVAAKRDVVAITTSDLFLDGVLRLMDSDSGEGSVARDGRFVATKEKLPKDGHGEVWFDMGGLIGFAKNLLGMAAGFAENDPDAAAGLKVAKTILDELALVETIGQVDHVEGSRFFADIRVTMGRRNGEPGFIERLIAAQEPVGDYCRGVPADALGFHVLSGVRPVTIYDALLKLLGDLPEGNEALEEWGRAQRQIGIDFRGDVLSWIDGGCGCISLPSKTPGGLPEHVGFLRVTNREKAQEILEKLYRKIRGYVTGRGHAMDLVPVDGLDETFRELRIAALPWLRLTFGMPGDVFVVATSPDAAQRVAATVMGQAPSIVGTDRFRALGLPEGRLCDVYWYDVEGQLEGVANVLGAYGFFLSLIPEERDTRPVIHLGSAMTKLAAFLRDVDWMTESAGWSVYDAESGTIRSRRMAKMNLPAEQEF